MLSVNNTNEMIHFYNYVKNKIQIYRISNKSKEIFKINLWTVEFDETIDNINFLKEYYNVDTAKQIGERSLKKDLRAVYADKKKK